MASEGINFVSANQDALAESSVWTLLGDILTACSESGIVLA